MTGQHPFFKFLRDGVIILDENTSFIIIFNEGSFLFPVRSFNRLELELIKILGKEKAGELLKNIGRFQVEQAIKRYVKLLGMNELEKDKILRLAKDIISMLGVGKFKIYQKDEKSFEIEFEPYTIFSFEAIKEYGKLDFNFDFLISGMFEKGFESIYGGEFQCEEISCYAKGDEKCKFVCKKKE